MPRILILRTGQTAPALRARAGDYLDWFVEALGLGAEITAIDCFAGAEPPAWRGFDGILMTGSPLSVCDYDHTPWMQAAGRYLAKAVDAGAPVLAVCFGHQLLARERGGRVERNPRGREIGTMEVTLTDAGRDHSILGALPDMRFQATHQDAVTALPADAVPLAENDYGIQGYRLGERALCVQFHPEIDAATMRVVIESREAVLRREGLYESALAGLRQTPTGTALLRAWLDSLRG